MFCYVTILLFVGILCIYSLNSLRIYSMTMKMSMRYLLPLSGLYL